MAAHRSATIPASRCSACRRSHTEHPAGSRRTRRARRAGTGAAGHGGDRGRDRAARPGVRAQVILEKAVHRRGRRVRREKPGRWLNVTHRLPGKCWLKQQYPFFSVFSAYSAVRTEVFRVIGQFSAACRPERAGRPGSRSGRCCAGGLRRRAPARRAALRAPCCASSVAA